MAVHGSAAVFFDNLFGLEFLNNLFNDLLGYLRRGDSRGDWLFDDFFDLFLGLLDFLFNLGNFLLGEFGVLFEVDSELLDLFLEFGLLDSLFNFVDFGSFLFDFFDFGFLLDDFLLDSLDFLFELFFEFLDLLLLCFLFLLGLWLSGLFLSNSSLDGSLDISELLFLLLHFLFDFFLLLLSNDLFFNFLFDRLKLHLVVFLFQLLDFYLQFLDLLLHLLRRVGNLLKFLEFGLLFDDLFNNSLLFLRSGNRFRLASVGFSFYLNFQSSYLISGFLLVGLCFLNFSVDGGRVGSRF